MCFVDMISDYFQLNYFNLIDLFFVNPSCSTQFNRIPYHLARLDHMCVLYLTEPALIQTLEPKPTDRIKHSPTFDKTCMLERHVSCISSRLHR